MNSRRIDLPNGWHLNLEENPDEGWIILLGPRGEGAAFSCEPNSVRAEVIHALIAEGEPLDRGGEP